MTLSVQAPEHPLPHPDRPVDRYWMPWVERLLVFALAFAFIFLASSRFINLYDEGIILTGASQMQRGLVIHRDFYANYGPAQFWLLSNFFSLFGAEVLIERIYDILIRSALALIAYGILLQYVRKSVAWVAVAFIVIWLGTTGSSGYPMYPALALILASVALLSSTWSSNRPHLFGLASGTLSGLAFLFKYDVGIYGILAQIAFIFFGAIFVNGENKQLSRQTMATAAGYAMGVALPVAGLVAYLWAHGALQGFVHDIFVFSAGNYSQTRGLPMPSPRYIVEHGDLSSLSVYLPSLTAGSSVLLLWLSHRQRDALAGPEKRLHLVLLALTFLTIVFFMRGIVRASVEHIQVALLPSILLLFIGWSGTSTNKFLRNGLSLFLASLFLLCTTHSAFERISHYPILGKAIAEGGIPKAYWFFVDPQRDSALQFVLKNTTEGESIFVGAGRHDKIFANDVSLYFLSQRRPATHWYQFDPGLQSNAEIQEMIVRDLEKNKPRIIWSESTWDNMNEPNTSALSTGVVLLDKYIADHYAPIATFGTINILSRR